MSIADKNILFAGAGGQNYGTPWGTIGEITGRALAPLGYDLTIERRAWSVNNPRFVSDGRADFGSTRLLRVRQAYESTGNYEEDDPKDNLRVLACINHPSWLGVAVRWETGITDLRQIKERRIPVRIYDAAPERAGKLIWEYYELTAEMLESWGGVFLPRNTSAAPGLPNVRGEWARSGSFDVIVDNIYSSYTPEIRHWHEATVLHNLRFLALPDKIIPQISTEIGGVPGFIPHNLFRGVTENIPAAGRGPQAIYGRDDMPEEFAYLLAKTLDENRRLFREVHISFSYDPDNVAETDGLPLHPGAERYYMEMGYIG